MDPTIMRYVHYAMHNVFYHGQNKLKNLKKHESKTTENLQVLQFYIRFVLKDILRRFCIEKNSHHRHNSKIKINFNPWTIEGERQDNVSVNSQLSKASEIHQTFIYIFLKLWNCPG